MRKLLALGILVLLPACGGGSSGPSAVTPTTTTTTTLPPRALWTAAGVGPSVLDMPTDVSRVRITGVYGGSCENFIIRVGGELVVNEILGTCSVASGREYSGTHLVRGGVVEVRSSVGISWTFTEVRV